MVLPSIPSVLCLMSLCINIFHFCGMKFLFCIVYPGWRRVDVPLWVFFPTDSCATKMTRAKSNWAKAVLVLQELDSQAAGKNQFFWNPILSTKEKNPFIGALGLLWYSTSMLDNISMLALELGILVFEELINIMDKPRVLLFLLIFWLNFYLGNVHVQEEWQLVGEVGRGRWSAWGLFSRNHSVTVHCVIRKTKKKAKWLWCGLAFFQLLT